MNIPIVLDIAIGLVFQELNISNNSTTSNPTLRFSVPSLGNSSRMIAQIACLSSGTSGTVFPWNRPETFLYNSPISIQWGQSPPSTASVGVTYNISVTTPSTGGNVTWTFASYGGQVTSTSSVTANLFCWMSGQKTVTATYTDVCSGQSASISKQIVVN